MREGGKKHWGKKVNEGNQIKKTLDKLLEKFMTHSEKN